MAYYFASQLMMNTVGRVSLSEKANSLYLFKRNNCFVYLWA